MKKKYLNFFLISISLVIIITNCKTTEPVETETDVKEEITYVKPESLDVQITQNILNPKEGNSKLNFKLASKNDPSNPVVAWKLTIKDMNNNTVSEKNGKNELPSEYSWDITSIKDGKYYTELETEYKGGSKLTGKSDTFIIDTTPPDISIDIDKDYFSPDNDGIKDELVFSFPKAEDLSGIKEWKLIIYSPFSGEEFSSVGDNNKPEGSFVWDGKSYDGELVESVTEYPAKLTAIDMAGNILEKELNPIQIGILVYKLEDGRHKIRISNIKFKPNKAEMTEDEKNTEILDMLITALKKFQNNKIIIEGYANRYRKGLNDSSAKKLSLDRAKTITDELIIRGIDSNRISSLGKGFDNPIIPLKDKMTPEEKKDMAVNRRVEFFIEK